MVDLKLSIIIPTLKRPKSLGYLLDSLKAQNLSQDHFEIILVSNLKDPATERLAYKFKAALNISYFVRGELGVNKARNLGLAHARGRILLFLDDDCQAIDQNFLKSHLDLHSRYPEFDGIGGPYVNGPKTSSLGRAYNFNSRTWLERGLLKAPRTLSLIGGNTSYKARVFDGRRHFNENIQFGGSESEFNHRLCQEGLRLGYFRDLQIAHHPPIGLIQFCRKALKQGVGSSEQDRHPQEDAGIFNSKSNAEKFYLWIYRLFFQAGVHLKSNPRIRTPNQIRLLGSLFLTATQPAHDSLARLGSKAYHFQRLHAWKLFKPYIWRLKQPLYWLHLNLWKLKLPFHWLHLNLWKLKMPFIKVQILAMKLCYLWLMKPFYFLGFQYRKRIRPLLTGQVENKN